MKKIVISVIKLYNKTQWLPLTPLSRILGIQNVCRFTPTCSEYTKQAISKYGVLYGIGIGLKRISTCRPGNDPKVDPLL